MQSTEAEAHPSGVGFRQSAAIGAGSSVPLRILMVPEWYPWPGRPGEAPWARDHAQMVARRYDVVVLPSRPATVPAWSLSDSVEEGVRTLRVEYRETGNAYTSFVLRLLGLAAAVRRLAGMGWVPDVIHARVFFSGFASLLLARALDVPVVISEHYTAFPRGLVTGVSRTMAKISFERAALVCPDSEDLGRCIRALGISGRFRHVSNLVDTSVFSPRQDRHMREAPARAVNVASLDPKKGHDVLLDAMAQIKHTGSELSLDVIGDGPCRGALERRSVELGLGDAVHFRGPALKSEVAAAMRASDFFVLPSHYENAPHVLIEAMATGLPAVATNVGGVSEIVDESSGLLVPAGDVSSLARALTLMCDHYADYDSDRLHRVARERWGHERVSREWSAIYESEVARRPVRARRTTTFIGRSA